MRILLVEDNPADAELIGELLSDYPENGFSISHAGRVESALAALGQGETDLVLLDLGLPDSQGMETVRTIRAAAGGIPIVVLTGITDEDVGVRALQEGAQDYLAKGWMSGPALIRSIRYAEERNRSAAELVRKNAELAASREDLRVREEHLRRAQEIAHLGSWELSGGRLSWSDEVYRIFGVRPQEFSPTYRAYLDAIHPEDRGRVEAAYRDSVRDGRSSYEIEYRIVRFSDGAVRDLYERCTHIQDARGHILGSEGIAQDVTAWKQAEERLKQYAAELERSNRELQRFAYVASHDLQEPLRSIVSFSQLLERRYRGRLDDDADEFIQYIVEGGNRMQTLIQDLLTFSRVMTKAAPIVRTDADVVVADAVRTLTDAITSARATVTVDPMPQVMADTTQLGQVFTNLIGNAVKYRRLGEPLEVTISARRTGGMVEFAVVDNGIGIEAEYFDRIFEMFRRLHTHDQYEGTGIGLAVVKRIIERHGGRVWVESVPGTGSTFFFTLKAA